MSSVSVEIVTTIKNLQKLDSLSSFSLGGGTNLALRYNHRESLDIDLFTDKIIGRIGFDSIQSEIESFFGKDISSFSFPCNINDQFIFARCFINCNDKVIKVELLQNMKRLHEIEVKDKIRLVSKKDIGLFKLISAANRAAKKDVYDLDYITEEIPLIDLYKELKIKVKKHSSDSDKTIFDLDEERCPISNPNLLLSFDKQNNKNQFRPSHSDDSIQKFEGKTWNSARYSWRKKVRELFTYLDIPFPKSPPIDL
ncbi:nucleotidyl transferase AbiEii/AbiGii toxin family protein [Brumimicrobium glaciale]|nr:nucleotidyl transferase AbiEii/AbiGii toxin family protein [Brumimicrobium glaciale]